MGKKSNFKVKKILIASDHAGYSLKEIIKNKLKKNNLSIIDFGTNNKETSVDYPFFAKKLCKKIDSTTFGILICGSGIGMSIASNRFKNVRSALITSVVASKLSRQHNNANVICIGARLTPKNTAIKSILAFLNTKFEGGRHLRRVKLLG